jgi:hypothetical protein
MKYTGLKSYLSAQRQPRLRLSFEEVGKRAGVRLPVSAYEHPAWWANDSKSHVQAKAWLEAGYKTENVDLAAQRVEFVRSEAPARGVREMQNTYEHKTGAPVKKHPAAGALKGTFTISPSWDLTKPALDPDELAEWEANIERMGNEVLSPRIDDARLDDKRRRVRETAETELERPSGRQKHPAAGLLKGTFTIRDWDVTHPALDADEYAAWEVNILRKMDDVKKGLRGKQ